MKLHLCGKKQLSHSLFFLNFFLCLSLFYIGIGTQHNPLSSLFFSFYLINRYIVLFLLCTSRLSFFNQWMLPMRLSLSSVSRKQDWRSLANQSTVLLVPADQCETPLYRHVQHANISSGSPTQQDSSNRRTPIV